MAKLDWDKERVRRITDPAREIMPGVIGGGHCATDNTPIKPRGEDRHLPAGGYAAIDNELRKLRKRQARSARRA